MMGTITTKKVTLLNFRCFVPSKHEYRSSSPSKGQHASSSRSTLSSYIPPDMQSHYMTLKTHSTSSTLPRRLPSMTRNDNDAKTSINKSVYPSPSRNRNTIVRSIVPEIKTELKSSAFNQKLLLSPPNCVKTSSTTMTTTTSSYPSALCTLRHNNNLKSNDHDAKPSHVFSSTSANRSRHFFSNSLGEELKYKSLPRKYTYGIKNVHSNSSPSYLSTSSSQQQERSSSLQPNYKQISMRSIGSHSPKLASGISPFEEGKSYRKYFSKSETSLSRPSSRPW